MCALADAGLSSEEKTTGRTTARRLAFINLSVYLSQKVCIFIFFYYITSRPMGQGGGDRRPEHSRRDRDATTNETKLLGQMSYMNSHSRTLGQRVV